MNCFDFYCNRAGVTCPAYCRGVVDRMNARDAGTDSAGVAP